ncbi:hypothetical protein QFZ29_003081 [Agromyces albus]|nr:hypothetical protein [Agromyces albus]
MPRDTPSISRRTALRLGIVTAWSVGTLAFTTAPALAAVPAVPAPPVTYGSNAPRFRFDFITALPMSAPLTRLEQVWASPQYMRITDCAVRYVGAETFELTADESAVVDVAEAAGAVVDDRRALYLLILAASTRIDPASLDAKLAELGRPVVLASLALAPEAPQAAQFGAWLERAG